MPLNDGDKLNRIEELKRKLFSKNYKTEVGHTDKFIHSVKKDIPDSWESSRKEGDYQNKFFMKTSVFKNFFFASLAFFGLTLIYASYVFFGGGNTVSNDNIDIAIIGNNFTAGGEELSFVVGITNKNNSSLDLADLVIEYPKSSASALDPSPQMERSRISLGTIPAGSVRNENLKVVLFGEQGTMSSIKISLEYRVEGSNAIFVKKKDYDVTISSTPLNLSVEAPFTVSPNQDVTLKIKAALNSTRAVPKMLLRADYPVGFVFATASPAPTSGNNVWNLGDMAPGVERVITVNGKMLDVVDGEEKSFRISGGSQSEREKSVIGSVFNSLIHTIAIKKPFIEAHLSINGASSREYAILGITPVQGEIRWTNNLDTKVNDLSIKAKISGSAVNRKTINAERGFYNSLGGEDVIVWDKNSLNDFQEVNPGDFGTVGFSLSSLPLFSALGILSDPVIKVDISISGKQLVSGYATEDLQNSNSGIIRIISDVGFTSKALYYSGPFTNSGPIPPKVEQKTTYTVTWSLSNTSNNISKAVVRSTLPPWVDFADRISPTGADLVYNPSTRELVWNAGRIQRGVGITAAEQSVSFQIFFTPSLSQARTTPIIVNEAVLTGRDDFANVDVRVSKPSLRTALDSDPGFPADGGVVVE